jgi:hypothetical protein
MDEQGADYKCSIASNAKPAAHLCANRVSLKLLAVAQALRCAGTTTRKQHLNHRPIN